jgi:hypothetical protein
MTVRELIEKLSEFPPDMRVTLWDPDTDWLMPIQVLFLPEEQPNRECEFVAITGDYDDEIEGHGPYRS